MIDIPLDTLIEEWLTNFKKRLHSFDFDSFSKIYESYSYNGDCVEAAHEYDRKLIDMHKRASKSPRKCIYELIRFLKEDIPDSDVIAHSGVEHLHKDLISLMENECKEIAKEYDDKYLKIIAMERSSSTNEEALALIKALSAEPNEILRYIRIATEAALKALRTNVGFEDKAIAVEGVISSLEKSQKKGANPALWCDKVDEIGKNYSADVIKAARNYNTYLSLVDDAIFSRKVIRCSEYIKELGDGWYFERVYALNAGIADYKTDLETVVPDFSGKWDARLEDAKKASIIQAEKWVSEAASERDNKKKFTLIEKAVKYGNIKAMGELGYYFTFGIGTDRNSEKAVHWIQKALDSGLEDGYFCYSLGWKYEHGDGVAKNATKAFELYKRGVGYSYRGNDCYRSLAYCYLNGVGTQKDPKGAFDYFTKVVTILASQENSQEYYWLGYLKETSKEVGIDERAALEYYKKSEKLGYAKGKEAAARLGKLLSELDNLLSLIAAAEKSSQSLDFEKAYKWDGEFANAARRDTFKSRIGEFDKKWKTVMTHARKLADVKAEEWFRQAYAMKNSPEQYTLMHKAAIYFNKKAMGETAYYYFYGLGVEKNRAKSFFWLNRALNEFGLEDGYFYCLLGWMHEHGDSTPKNEKLAFSLYEKGVKFPYRGFDCLKPIGYCYLNGKGTAKDDNKAFEVFSRYCDQTGDKKYCADEYYWLGNLMETSAQLGKKNEREALKYYELAEKAGSGAGKTNATRLRNKFAKIALDKSIDACFALAQKGDPQAMFELGEYYYTGKGVTRSYTDAYAWFEKAAKKGNVRAIERLGDCYMNGHGVKQNYAKAEKYYNQAAKLSR
ncbi:MAG: sel1 repeat family protein [Clostridia bacterium]|nr:sel1 repeat family protein [Clostridia bacterium]